MKRKSSGGITLKNGEYEKKTGGTYIVGRMYGATGILSELRR